MTPVPSNEDFDIGVVDASIATRGLSRWHNYYLEGLRWIMEYTGLKGLYLDGIGFDREIMKRVTRVMYSVKPNDWYINFHNGNAAHDRMNEPEKITPMIGMMEHLPYVSQLHFGEQFDYSRAPDYWLIEMAGIPFGLVNEIRGTPFPENLYRAMLYGGAGRFDAARYDLWTYWDDFGIQDTEMIGYWQADCPVQTSHPDVLATVYKKADISLIALASWARGDVNVTLTIDWAALGLDPATGTLNATAIPNFQAAAAFDPMSPILVQSDSGWLLEAESPVSNAQATVNLNFSAGGTTRIATGGNSSSFVEGNNYVKFSSLSQAGGQIVVDLENYNTGGFNGWCVAAFQVKAAGP